MRQEPLLFDDTLKANIVFGLDRVEDAAFDVAVTLSGVKAFASRHPQGYGLRSGRAANASRAASASRSGSRARCSPKRGS